MLRGGGDVDKCIGCVWADVTMRDEDDIPIQVYCLRPGQCKRQEAVDAGKGKES